MTKQAQRALPPTQVTPARAATPAPSTGPRVSRRGLLVGAGAVGIGAYALADGAVTGRIGGLIDGWLHPLSAQAAVTHLLRRAGFSGNATEQRDYARLGFASAVDKLVDYEKIPDTFAQATKGQSFNFINLQDSQRWWLLRMILTPRPLQEKMTLFWHGLLTSSYAKSNGRMEYQVQQNEFLRAHAVDTFDNLLLCITHDPAMLWWLDLRISEKANPNENYARELMELFTMGVRGGYTQKDVHEAARALTGWGTDEMQHQAVYDPNNHDDSPKTLLGHTGRFDYRDVIHILTNHPATGPFLCKRLFRFFVHEQPTDADVKPMVDAYNKHGHSIREVVRAMFHSPAFLAPESVRGRLKSPAEFVTGAVRQLELATDGRTLSGVMSTMGQSLFDPPNVAGWVGDQRSATWLNSGTWLARVNHINALLDGTDDHFHALFARYQLTTPQAVVDHFTHLTIDGEVTDAVRQSLLAHLTADAGGPSIPLAGGQARVSASGLRGTIYLLMTSPAYLLS